VERKEGIEEEEEEEGGRTNDYFVPKSIERN
jgi:hypothetical protein